jgi:hypothetical protein
MPQRRGAATRRRLAEQSATIAEAAQHSMSNTPNCGPTVGKGEPDPLFASRRRPEVLQRASRNPDAQRGGDTARPAEDTVRVGVRGALGIRGDDEDGAQIVADEDREVGEDHVAIGLVEEQALPFMHSCAGGGAVHSIIIISP